MEKKVRVVVPPPLMEFNFDSSNCSSPYITAPSSPQRFGNFFFSVPTSPTRNNNVSSAASVSSSSSSVPQQPINNNEVDFEFNFSCHLERSEPSLSADELFHAGKILPLNLKKEEVVVQGEGAAQQQRASPFFIPSKGSGKRSFFKVSGSSSSNRHSSSVSESESECDDVFSKGGNSECVSSTTTSAKTLTSESAPSSTFLSFLSFSRGYYRKWRLKDFLLFRSASEGRATDKDPLSWRRKKYAVLSKTTAHEDVSFRSTESSGSVSSRRRGPVSAHELHYKLNRAASEEMKKKTMLPYKQGLLGCLGFNHHGMRHIGGRFGSFERS